MTIHAPEETPSVTNTTTTQGESLRVQLAELNTRARTYTSRMWQVPFAYVGIIGVVFAEVADKEQEIFAIALGIGMVFGILVLVHLTSLMDGVRRAVDNIRKVERALSLEQTAEYRPWWYISPLIGLVISAILFCAVGAGQYYFQCTKGIASHDGTLQPLPPGR